MTPRGGKGLLASISFLLYLAGAGCNKRVTVESRPVASAAASSSGATPIDRLAPGELAASSQLAFGLPVPVGMSVDRAYSDAVHLKGDVAVPALVEYLRKYAQLGNAELAESRLRFEGVRIPSNGAERRYSVEVAQQGSVVRLVIRDVTAPPMQPGLSEEERWKQAGLKPNGQPLSIVDLR